MKRLNAQDIENAHKIIDAVFLNSPQYVCESLGDALGEDAILMIKAEPEKVKNDIAPWRETGVETTFEGMKADAIGG